MKAGWSAARRFLTRRPWVSAAVVVIVAGAAVGTVLVRSGSDTGAAAAATTSRLVSVTTGTVRQAVSAMGTLAPADEEDVSFSSSALITSVKVAQGQKVVKGQLLGTIATASLEATLAQARADLATAKSTLATAEDDSDTTDAQLAADRAAVTSARSAVADAKDALANAALRSPIAGTVAEVNVAEGDTSSGSGSSRDTSAQSSGTGSSAGDGASTTGGTTSASSTSSSSSSGDFVVIGLKSWSVSASVDDTEVGLISKGDQVQLTTDNVSGTVFGTVSSVSVLSSSSSGSATYPVEIAVTGTPTGLHDGASATVSIIYRQVGNVLTVTTQAVHRDGASSYVYVSKDGSRSKQAVTTGLASGGVTQIKSGLSSGQQVYVDTAARTTTGATSTRAGNTGNQNGGGYPGSNGGGNFPGGGNPPGGGAQGGNR